MVRGFNTGTQRIPFLLFCGINCIALVGINFIVCFAMEIDIKNYTGSRNTCQFMDALKAKLTRFVGNGILMLVHFSLLL